MDLLVAFRVFVRVAEAGSFSAVARDLGLTQPAVSRQISAIEEHLGVRLLQRTTRSMALTEDGVDLLVHARQVLDSVERAEIAVGRRHSGVTGMVRLSAGTSFGHMVIAPRLHRLIARHPGLHVDLTLDDRRPDLVHEGVDVAIRLGNLGDTSLIARRLGLVSLAIVGSADYLAARGEPDRPEDLALHDCILFAHKTHPTLWQLEGVEGVQEVRVGGPFRTNSVEAARVAVNTGLGLAILPAWMMCAELNSGAVRAVLPGWAPAPIVAQAVYPSQRNLAPRTRAVIDFLVEEFRTDPTLSGRQPPALAATPIARPETAFSPASMAAAPALLPAAG